MDLYYLNYKNITGKNAHEKQHKAGRYIVEYVGKNIFKLDNTELTIINKKPHYKFSDIQFSISHTKNYVVVIFDKHNIGVDIETIKNRDFKYIAKRMNFHLKDESLDSFYEEWTLYEATYKLQEKAQSTYSFKFKDEYKISVVSSETTDIKNNLNIIELTF